MQVNNGTILITRYAFTSHKRTSVLIAGLSDTFHSDSVDIVEMARASLRIVCLGK